VTRGRRLRRLDDAWVPGASAALRRRVAALRRRSTSLHSVRHAVDEQPALAASIGAVLVAALLIGVADDRGTGSQRADPAVVVPTQPAPLVATIGPVPGASVSTYRLRAAYDLRHYGEIAAGRPTYAIIDLRRYETPAEVRVTFDGVEVVRAYVRIPSRLPTEVRGVPLPRGIGDLATGLRTTGTVAASTARTLTAVLTSLNPKRKAERLLRQRYAAQQQAAQVEAAALSRPERCRCVFAMVVRADIARLASLARLSQVRVVDPASPVVPLTGLTVLPLEPDVTTVVRQGASPRG
jgi:hypothetical protein